MLKHTALKSILQNQIFVILYIRFMLCFLPDVMFKNEDDFRIQRYKTHSNQLSKVKKNEVFAGFCYQQNFTKNAVYSFPVLVPTQISYLHQNNCVLSKKMEFAMSDIFQYFLNATFHALFDEVEMSKTVNKELYMCGNQSEINWAPNWMGKLAE